MAPKCYLSKWIARLLREERGGVLVGFAAALPVLAVAAGVAVDYGLLTKSRLDLQAAADQAALAGAAEFRLANSSTSKISVAAQRVAKAALSSFNLNETINVVADPAKMSVEVGIKATQATHIIGLMGGNSEVAMAVTAKAMVRGTAAICVVGLYEKEKETIYMEKNAKLQAPNCAIYSNSKHKDGLKALENSQIKARFICTAGGKYSDKGDAFSPTPQVDCPVLSDPLAAREPPPVGGCFATNLKITSSVTMHPGTYCGGVTIEKTAIVDMAPGVYVFKDGPLNVTGSAKLRGNNVGIYLTGKGARIKFDSNTSISLTAPKDGPMAGMLFFEDRAKKFGEKHEILSNDAKILLGTIYFSTGELSIASSHPVAQDSAYTIIVARRFSLSAGPTMVVNTNYTGTDIPVPAGVGPGGSAPFLTQ